MKEAIGGGWMLGFVVIFIVLFSAYLAFSINYSKAFKVKNEIINIIEQNEGFTELPGENSFSGKDDAYFEGHSETNSKIYLILRGFGYLMDNVGEDACGDNDGEFHAGGYCVKKVCTSQGAYYKVTTFLSLELPIVGFNFLLPIRGETKVLFFTQDDGC